MVETDNVLTLRDSVKVNAIVWVRSLPETERGPSRRMTEDLGTLARAAGQRFTVIDVGSRIELAATLEGIADQAAKGLRPILHMDAHGETKDGILLAPSGECVPWSDVIEGLRAVNVATDNNLVCVFALCHGLHLYKLVDLKKAAPAYLFIAPPGRVTVGQLEAATLAFYEDLGQTGDVTGAFRRNWEPVMESFHCQGLFLRALAHYVRAHCQGAAKAVRQEKVVTQLVEKTGVTTPSRALLRQARAKARNELKPGPHLIQRYAETFLIGRPVKFTYADVERAAKITKTTGSS